MTKYGIFLKNIQCSKSFIDLKIIYCLRTKSVIFNLGGAPALLARKIAAAEKEAAKARAGPEGETSFHYEVKILTKRHRNFLL
jgi:hypothetical protein